jgi:hypothetical protein
MANHLSPLYAANLAANVYDIKSIITREDFLDEYKSDMEISSSKMASGVTGGIILNKPHVMAIFSAGIGNYKGQAFIAIKGTASLYDALTDINTGLRTSHTGFSVHQGFYYALNSIMTELRLFVSSLQGVNVVHCVGHSLGGAIATLAADWIKSSGKVPTVKLYTFGSPRVGLEMFASKCSDRLTAGNIYRVYHQTDPVPMVPTWPFHHVPKSGADYLVYSPLGAIPWEYHLMEHYVTSAKEFGDWSLIKNNRPKLHHDLTIEKWLKSDSAISFSANTLELLNAALLYVIKKVIHAAGIILVTAAATTFTLLDRLAIFMAKAAHVSADLSSWVYHLVKKIAALIGITVKKGADLTVTLIRMVFIRLHNKISEMILKVSQVIL